MQADSRLIHQGSPLTHTRHPSHPLFGHQTAESHCQVAPPLRPLVLRRSEPLFSASAPTPSTSSLEPWPLPRSTAPYSPSYSGWIPWEASTLCPTTPSGSSSLTRPPPRLQPTSHPTYLESPPAGVPTLVGSLSTCKQFSQLASI